MASQVPLTALPSSVHQAVCYLRDNLHHAITLHDLIAAVGAPERTLHRQFRKELGMTPWAYLRTLRLAAARRVLSEHSDDTITSIALSVGYTHFSRFARDYNKQFGELPSATRRGARAARRPGDQINLSHPHRPFLWMTPFHANTLEERQLAEAMADHLATELSRSGIATVAFRRPAILQRTIVDQEYSLLGRLTQAAGKLRLTLRLINDAAGHHVWAETFDGDASAPFAMQDRVARSVATGMVPALTSDEIRLLLQRPSTLLAARQIALRALPWALASDTDSAYRLLASTDLALEADPADALSLSFAALGHAQIANFLNSTCPTQHREHATRLSRRAMASGSLDALSLTALASAAVSLGRPSDEIERLTVQALAIDPMLGWAWSRMGFLRLNLGQASRALADFRRAMQLSGPGLPRTLIFNGLSRVALATGSRAKNVAYSLQAMAENPKAAWVQVNLICAYQAAGELAAMRDSLSQLRAACPNLTVSLFANCRPHLPAQCLQIMRDAGLPLN